jgi:hypothetical protein
MNEEERATMNQRFKSDCLLANEKANPMATMMTVRIGGSHRKYQRQWPALQPFAHNLPIRTGIGSKFFTVNCDDTTANREIVKKVGATVQR